MSRDAQKNMQRQMEESMRRSYATAKIRLTFEGSKVRLGSSMGIETVSPYRIKKDRLEIVYTQGSSEQLMVFRINEDGSLDGMIGHFVRVQ